jgi:nucleotide-binding universal stress UspA family protein
VPIIQAEPPIGPGLDESASNPHILQMAIRVRLILVPLDFSKHGDSVIEWAAHLAEEHQSSVVLLHAYHLPVEFQQVEGAYLPVDFWNSVKEEAKDQLSHYGERLRERGLSVEEITREGHPASVIEEEAERLGADLIVIGSRGRSGLKHLLLGSIAERVVQKAPCPVLTVKSPQS